MSVAPDQTQPRRRFPVLLAVIVGFALLVVGGTVAFLATRGGGDDKPSASGTAASNGPSKSSNFVAPSDNCKVLDVAKITKTFGLKTVPQDKRTYSCLVQDDPNSDKLFSLDLAVTDPSTAGEMYKSAATRVTLVSSGAVPVTVQGADEAVCAYTDQTTGGADARLAVRAGNLFSMMFVNPTKNTDGKTGCDTLRDLMTELLAKVDRH